MTYDSKTTSTASPAPTEARDCRTDSEFLTDLDQSPQDQLEGGSQNDTTQHNKHKLATDSASCSSSTDPSSSSSFDQDEKSSLTLSANNNSINQEPDRSVNASKSIEKQAYPLSTQSDDCRVIEDLSRTLSEQGGSSVCYNSILDDEIRNRLDKLNALSDLINSLEVQFDQANALFRETLKCSTDRLSTIAKNLGSKSIRQGRLYHAAKLSVEQTQSDCQKACVHFERANINHQHAKLAIKEAESKLHAINNDSSHLEADESSSGVKFESIDIGRLSLDRECDKVSRPVPESLDASETKLMNSAKLSEDLNRAIITLVEAEEERNQKEKLHLDQANKLMIAQEYLTKLEREHGASIKRAQVYFEESRRFNAKLNSVKGDIARVSEDIMAAKQAYARTLRELEQFSEDLHLNGKHLIDSQCGNVR